MKPPLRFGLVCAWPWDIRRGTGTARYLIDLSAALERISGIELVRVAGDFDPADYPRFVLERLAWNLRLARDPSILALDALICVDYDGFRVPSPPVGPPRIVCPQAVFARLAPTEPEPFRSYLEVQAAAEERSVRDAASVIASCGWVADAVAGSYGRERSRIEIVPLGFDGTSWLRMLGDSPPRVRGGAPVVLSVAKLYPRKGIDVLLRAFSRVRESVPGARLVIVGDGPEWGPLHALADSLGLAGEVDFEGDVDDRRRLASLYAAADCFCLPSRHETFGFVYVEAMLAGLPIVAVRAAAVPETVADAGLLVDVDDPGAVAESVISVLTDPVRAADLSVRGRARGTAFDWDRTAAGYRDAVARALATAAVSRA